MDAPPPIPPPPPLAADPIGHAGGPAPEGARCGGCKYDLAGLDRAGVCPECGLDVAASLAAWDRGAGHPLYARRLRGEAMAMRWVAVWLAVVPVLAGVVGVGLGLASASDPYSTAGYGSLIAAIQVLGWSALLILLLLAMLLALWCRLRRHPNDALADGRAERARLRVGCVVLGAALVASWVFAFVFFWGSASGSVAPGVASLVVALASAVVLCHAGLRYATQMMGGSGVEAAIPGLWTLAAIVAVGGVALAPLVASGPLAWLVAAAAAAAGLATLACGLAVQSYRAIRVLDACAAGGR